MAILQHALITWPIREIILDFGVKEDQVPEPWGKIYFWAMTGVAATALVLSFALPIFFLAMVAVFSFYSAFAAYRILYLKDMYKGTRPKAVDWLADCREQPDRESQSSFHGSSADTSS